MCLLGIALGLFAGPGKLSQMTTSECRFWAVVGFAFFVGSSALGALVERAVVGLGTALRRVVDRQAPAVSFSSPGGWKFLRYSGWLAASFGVGIAVSALWVTSLRFWQGLAFACSAVGIILGEKLAMRILMQPGANRE